MDATGRTIARTALYVKIIAIAVISLIKSLETVFENARQAQIVITEFANVTLEVSILIKSFDARLASTRLKLLSAQIPGVTAPTSPRVAQLLVHGAFMGNTENCLRKYLSWGILQRALPTEIVPALLTMVEEFVHV